MTRLTRLLLIALALGLAIPGAALGKGASEATITGPGIGDGITLAGEGQTGGEQLMQLAEHAGFFAAVFSSLESGPAGAACWACTCETANGSAAIIAARMNERVRVPISLVSLVRVPPDSGVDRQPRLSCFRQGLP